MKLEIIRSLHTIPRLNYIHPVQSNFLFGKPDVSVWFHQNLADTVELTLKGVRWNSQVSEARGVIFNLRLQLNKFFVCNRSTAPTHGTHACAFAL